MTCDEADIVLAAAERARDEWRGIAEQLAGELRPYRQGQLSAALAAFEIQKAKDRAA